KKSLLFITDGYSNSGTDLKDVFLAQANLGSRIFGLELQPEEKENSVIVVGPNKVVSNAETEYEIIIGRTQKPSSVKLDVFVDDEEFYSKKTEENSIRLTFSFPEGEHRIVARIESEDIFAENNVFYKRVQVVDKPKILILSKKESKLSELLEKLYDVDRRDYLPDSLDEYYGIIVEDIDANDLFEKDINKIEEFLDDENGLFVTGGKNSYDYGGYNSSVFARILPVGIGTPKKEKDSVNIIISVDTGASGGQKIESEISGEDVSFIDVQKALAVNVIETIAGSSRVGVIESNVFPSIISKLSLLGPKRDELSEKITRLKLHDSTKIYTSLLMAKDLIRLERGSKNVILITDGNAAITWEGDVSRTQTFDQVQSLNNVQQLASDGIKVFVIGVGHKADEDFLKELARLGNGRYFHADQSKRLKIFFGDASIPTEDEELSVFIYDTNHFITEKIDPDISLTGFNSVYPKTNSRLLATTTNGDPILTIWRYGIGRVAALSTDPEKWAAGLLDKENSALLVRTVNWIVENPERKEKVIYEFPEFFVNKSARLTVYSEAFPEAEGLNFFEAERGVFNAYHYPEALGFLPLMNKTIAVNYNEEYALFGINPELADMVAITGGEILKPDPDSIVDKISSSENLESTRTIDLSWMFIIAAIVLYLIEIVARRRYDIKMRRIE
ncbi:MAG: VWA domain-containing protein, partial [Nanoarchaeota archaeon]|nr:VWA domain-containing protein [Nanoarchaeota archaeon]